MNIDIVAACAQAAHEVNRVYCLALEDQSQPDWYHAPDWQKHSIVLGVMNALRGATPEQSHAGWLEHKKATGWTYGERKDEIAKTHPCIKPYDELHPEQRMKDRLFIDVVNAMNTALSAANAEWAADAIGEGPCAKNALQDEVLKLREEKKQLHSELGDLLIGEGCSCTCRCDYDDCCLRCLVCRAQAVLERFR